MDDFEGKLNSIMANPDMMAQIMSMAQQLGGGQPESPSPPPPQPPELSALPAMGGLDMETISKLAGVANSASIDKNQQSLLHALRPYLANERITKLERAMRASKIAGVACTILSSGILTQTGR